MQAMAMLRAGTQTLWFGGRLQRITTRATTILSSSISGTTITRFPVAAATSTAAVRTYVKSYRSRQRSSGNRDELSPTAKAPSKAPKLAQLETVKEYDPTKIIFLDKYGNVTEIDPDNRATGQSSSDASLEDGDGQESGERKERLSPGAEFGKKRIGQVSLPESIHNALQGILDENDKSLIRTDSLRLFGSLRSMNALDQELTDNGPVTVIKRMKSGSKTDTRSEEFNTPHILEYGHRETVAYLAALSSTTFSAISNVLNEVRKRNPSWVPKKVLDFGTGPGTAIWAANETWPNQGLSYTGVDTSDSMLGAAEEVLVALKENDQEIKNVELKPFLSYGAQSEKFDMVVAAFVLGEITSSKLRESTLEKLWEATTDMLVLVDRGTPSGFKTLAEAREQILGLTPLPEVRKFKPKYDYEGNLLNAHEEEELKDAAEVRKSLQKNKEPAHVFAPCPHDGICPMYATLTTGSQWCHFSQKVERPDFLRKTKHSKQNYEDAKYTYVVLRKGPRPGAKAPIAVDTTATQVAPSTPPPPPLSIDAHLEALSQEGTEDDLYTQSHSWARIVVPPLKKDGHVVIDYCSTNGQLERMVIPKSQGKVPYKDARKAMWGDLFPHLPKNKPVVKTLGKVTRPDKVLNENAISAEALLKRNKNKEKKENRKKVTPENEARRERKQNREMGAVFEL